MKFQYHRAVGSPPHLAGAEGEICDREPWIVRQLVAEGYGVALEEYPEIPVPDPASPYPEVPEEEEAHADSRDSQDPGIDERAEDAGGVSAEGGPEAPA